MTELLIIEALIRLTAGTLLIAAPLLTLGMLGLDRPATGFWPRFAGALLIGLAAAAFIEVRLPGAKGLGLYGSIAIDVVAALVIMGALIMDGGAPTRRGRITLWLMVGLLLMLGLAGIGAS